MQGLAVFEALRVYRAPATPVPYGWGCPYVRRVEVERASGVTDETVRMYVLRTEGTARGELYV